MALVPQVPQKLPYLPYLSRGMGVGNHPRDRGGQTSPFGPLGAAGSGLEACNISLKLHLVGGWEHGFYD